MSFENKVVYATLRAIHGASALCCFTFQLIELGVSPELLSVTSSNATSFRFDGKRYFSESVFSSQEGVRTEDGGILHTGMDGVVGLEEFQR